MVFLAQGVTSVGRTMAFMVARYCLSSLSGRWVRTNKRQITATLGFFGFIVTFNSFDGATENRSAMNQDLSLSLQTLLPELATDTSHKYNDNDLPWDMMIAYPHPTLDDKIISAAADMPHAVKKQVNAIELSSKTNKKERFAFEWLTCSIKNGT